MYRSARRTFTTVVAVAGALTAVAAGATPAGAAAPVQKADADVTSGSFHLTFHATRQADQAPSTAKGTFDAWTTAGPLTLMHLAGPVTCLDVRGNRMGLFYPIASSSPSLFSQINSGVLISMTVDGNGHATAVQFLPVPVTHVSSCAPLPTLLPATGSATLVS
ncbi:hypothetical protein NBH00_15985 [Paraconexibacter antarcticus]|uniref:Uncharacterized protein n=1 Tax=Paraconexibacter antarcticus TaxID=2949664 RepID=A0ABY5DLU3_9ACTN|nr:hypothetical protein [Paraconexibacter antarcticus]UTI62856.1 hypothetical protein NBH00_15985 [Paraconexibacter antarcticus]